MTWLTSEAPPTESRAYAHAQGLVREATLLKVLLERDRLSEIYYSQKEGRRGGAEPGSVAAKKEQIASEKAAILESVNPHSREHSVVSTLHHTKAEITVARRLLDSELVKLSLNVIKSEHASLQATFEVGASNEDLQAFVHPQQQFAATLYQCVDENSHLNVLNKLDFVQTFLTKLRNRCTEVETLASGPGIVFSMKDFNDCLQSFC